jgi:serine/threonine protein phosphatase PrpC
LDLALIPGVLGRAAWLPTQTTPYNAQTVEQAAAAVERVAIRFRRTASVDVDEAEEDRSRSLTKSAIDVAPPPPQLPGMTSSPSLSSSTDSLPLSLTRSFLATAVSVQMEEGRRRVLREATTSCTGDDEDDDDDDDSGASESAADDDGGVVVLSRPGTPQVASQSVEDLFLEWPSEEVAAPSAAGRFGTHRPLDSSHPLSFIASASQDVGMRSYQEDVTYLCVPATTLYPSPPGCPPTAAFALFDGHRGSEAAHFAADHWLPLTLTHPSLLQDPTTALAAAARQVDTHFARCFPSSNAGTTALLALLLGKRLVVATVGDSVALACHRDGSVTELSPSNPRHSPSEPAEQARIAAAGGEVMHVMGTWRVSGILSVSRSIGDQHMGNLVPADAHVHDYGEVGDDLCHLVLVSDGVSASLTHDQIRSLVDGCRGRRRAAARVVRTAIKAGSPDNASCIVVSFEKKD